ncbi:hypothetical protein [Gemmatimonas sp.]|uniref:hypothetical protein n=1 Tax=Gemmatimonas sp. TaxID=1962908 RepID=UPI003983C449
MRTVLVRDRRGTALIIVMIAVVVIAVLSTGAFMTALQEFKSSRGVLMEQRALAVAEYGANAQFDAWTTAKTQMAVGAVDSSYVVGVARGDTARVSIMRLNASTFSLVSIGRASAGNGALEAQRAVNQLIRLNSANITPGAAIMSMGNIDVKGSIDITGKNTPPPGWADCAGYSSRDTFAIAYNPAKTATVQKPVTQAVGGTYQDPRAGDASTFTVFGTETFASLAAKANVITTGASPVPTGSASTCTFSASNWGEPNRGIGTVEGCASYFPIIYSNGDLSLNGGRGQGILLVNGSLRTNGNFKFVGLIVVMNDFRPNGTADIYGSVMIRNSIDNNTLGNGNARIAFSHCAVAKSLAALSRPARTRSRGWAQMF